MTNWSLIGLVNEAANDIGNFVSLPDEGVIDALNLMVNIVGSRLEDPTLTVEQVIARNYEASPEEVATWITS